MGGYVRQGRGLNASGGRVRNAGKRQRGGVRRGCGGVLGRHHAQAGGGPQVLCAVLCVLCVLCTCACGVVAMEATVPAADPVQAVTSMVSAFMRTVVGATVVADAAPTGVVVGAAVAAAAVAVVSSRAAPAVLLATPSSASAHVLCKFQAVRTAAGMRLSQNRT